ncbi:hypothetical protein [Streptomyces malaysiense]|nr:hypothetical protein [Streptomyces malaysiense]
MTSTLAACGGISSPRLLGEIRKFERAVAGVDTTAARECEACIRETL